jgi:hypothetical protein
MNEQVNKQKTKNKQRKNGKKRKTTGTGTIEFQS